MQTATTPSHAPQTRPALTPAEVSAVLRLHPTYTRALFTRRLIPRAIRIGARWILPAPALDRILAEGLSLPGKQKATR